MIEARDPGAKIMRVMWFSDTVYVGGGLLGTLQCNIPSLARSV